MPRRTAKSEFAYRLVAGTLTLFLKRVLRWKWDVRNIERVPEGRAILAFNHISYTDAFVTGLPLFWKGFRPRYLVKQAIFDTLGLGWLAKNAHMIPVPRSSKGGRQKAFATAVEFASQGELVLVAPEQTISKSFDLLPIRTGAVRMAQEAGVPIVPSANWGSQRFMTKGRPRNWIFRLPVTISYGEPIHIGPDDDPVEKTQELVDAMQALLTDAIETYPDEPTPGDDWWYPARLGGGAPDHDTVLEEHRSREDLA